MELLAIARGSPSLVVSEGKSRSHCENNAVSRASMLIVSQEMDAI